MGMADAVTKQYMKENTVFADAFNFLLYNGENVILPQTLRELDTAEVVIPFTVDDKGKKQAQAVQKYRDILKMTTVMTDDKAAYVLFGVEAQTDIHYAMPVRNVIYDALQYGRQVTEISKRNRKNSGQTMAVTDKGLLQHIPDYRIKLIDPAGIDSDEMDKFHTSLREVLSYIKYSKDADKLAEYMNHNQRMEHLEVGAAQVIKEVTNTKFQIPKGMEEVNMCEAIEVLMKRRETEGITQGKLSLLKELVDDGTLTMEAAAGKVNMSVEEFKEYTKKEL
jgi:putative transposase, yhgA-like